MAEGGVFGLCYRICYTPYPSSKERLGTMTEPDVRTESQAYSSKEGKHENAELFVHRCRCNFEVVLNVEECCVILNLEVGNIF